MGFWRIPTHFYWIQVIRSSSPPDKLFVIRRKCDFFPRLFVFWRTLLGGWVSVLLSHRRLTLWQKFENKIAFLILSAMEKNVQLLTSSLYISIYSLQAYMSGLFKLQSQNYLRLTGQICNFLNLLVNEAIYVYIAGPKKEQKTTSKRLRVSKRVSPFFEATERRQALTCFYKTHIT